MVSSAKQRAKKKNLSFNLTRSDILRLREVQSNRCALTGWELDWEPSYSGKRNCPPQRASLDRISSQYGYDIGNVQLVCDVVNRIKSAYDEHLFIEMCKAVTEFRS